MKSFLLFQIVALDVIEYDLDLVFLEHLLISIRSPHRANLHPVDQLHRSKKAASVWVAAFLLGIM